MGICPILAPKPFGSPASSSRQEPMPEPGAGPRVRNHLDGRVARLLLRQPSQIDREKSCIRRGRATFHFALNLVLTITAVDLCRHVGRALARLAKYITPLPVWLLLSGRRPNFLDFDPGAASNT
jgi:hypothetical protein